MREELQKYQELVDILSRYQLTEIFIKRQQSIFLELMLNPTISIQNAFNKFLNCEKSIDEAIYNYEKINTIFNEMNEQEVYILKNYFMTGKNSIDLARELGMSRRTFSRRVNKLVDKFYLKYNKGEIL